MAHQDESSNSGVHSITHGSLQKISQDSAQKLYAPTSASRPPVAGNPPLLQLSGCHDEAMVSPASVDSEVTDNSSHEAENLANESKVGFPLFSSGPVDATRPWKTFFVRFGPLSGITCMIVAVMSIVVSLGVLVGSRGAPVPSWSVEPSAYLAICTAVANQAMRYAAFQGVILAWWTGALRGSSIRHLHMSYRAGTTILGAVTAGRHMGLLGVACIVSTLVAVDGPFLQKATTIVTVPIHDHPIILNVSMVPELPAGYSGGWYVFAAHPLCNTC